MFETGMSYQRQIGIGYKECGLHFGLMPAIGGEIRLGQKMSGRLAVVNVVGRDIVHIRKRPQQRL